MYRYLTTTRSAPPFQILYTPETSDGLSEKGNTNPSVQPVTPLSISKAWVEDFKDMFLSSVSASARPTSDVTVTPSVFKFQCLSYQPLI